jgi:hypothetical protein
MLGTRENYQILQTVVLLVVVDVVNDFVRAERTPDSALHNPPMFVPAVELSVLLARPAIPRPVRFPRASPAACTAFC